MTMTTTTTIISSKKSSNIAPRTVPALSVISTMKSTRAAPHMLYRPQLVTQLPSDGWFEGSARRPNGRLLIARADQPELYELGPDDGSNAIPCVVFRFDATDASGIIDLCPLPGRPDEYIMLSGHIDLVNVQTDNYCIWRLDLRGVGLGAGAADDGRERPPPAELIFRIPDGGAIVAIEAISEDLVILGDQLNASIYALDTRARQITTLAASKDLFAPASEADHFGVNRLSHVAGHLWFTNSSRGLLGRMPADFAAGRRQVGDVEIVTTELEHCDGLAVSRDGTTAYAVGMTDGSLFEVRIPESGGKATTTVVMEELINPTALIFGPRGSRPKGGEQGEEEEEKKEEAEVLHVVCSGEIEVGWRDGHSQMSWAGFASTINECVSISVETVVETYDMCETKSTLWI